MAAINVLTVTYFLAIENYPVLQAIFPTFAHYIAIVVGTGVPLLVLVGYFHYKRSQAYAAEADINIEANPYWYKIPPGWNKEVVFPLYLTLSEMMIKWTKDEKLNNDDIEKLEDLQDKIQKLLRGEMVGEPRKKINTKFVDKEKTTD